MLDKLKQAVVSALKAARASVWAALLLAFPYADQLVALLDANMPGLAGLLPRNAYAFLAAAIVGAKFALQLLALADKAKAARAAKAGA